MEGLGVCAAPHADLQQQHRPPPLARKQASDKTLYGQSPNRHYTGIRVRYASRPRSGFGAQTDGGGARRWQTGMLGHEGRFQAPRSCWVRGRCALRCDKGAVAPRRLRLRLRSTVRPLPRRRR